MYFDPLKYRYPSRRNVVYGRKGMVATSHPLAAGGGLEILKKGGNAIDAAITTAAVLTVVEPTSNGIGGDAFALIWHNKKLYGLNASGPSPRAISIQKLLDAGYKEMPKYGVLPVTVPGAPAAWGALSKKFGRLPLKDLLAPAVNYAAEGFPVAPTTAKLWEKAMADLRPHIKKEVHRSFFQTFSKDGEAPKAGEIWTSKDMAKTLMVIGESYGETFYRGELAEKIDKFFRQYGGFLRKEDLESYRVEWVTPIKINYRGYDVWELPPNGQGIVALMALNILKTFEFTERDNVETLHKQIEAVKLAFADGLKVITDPKRMDISLEGLLSDNYAEERRKMIGREALSPTTGVPHRGGTVYLAAADEEGNMVSFIQSNYIGFGSGLVVPGTGISLHSRGNSFSLNKEDINRLEGGKRPYHTIIPGFLTKGSIPIGPFGVMGALMQPQGHVQVLMNAIDFHHNPQEALDAPRWQWIKGKMIAVEDQFPRNLAQQLVERGHELQVRLDNTSFGRGQIIWRNQEGVLCGGTEGRTDGSIAAW